MSAKLLFLILATVLLLWLTNCASEPDKDGPPMSNDMAVALDQCEGPLPLSAGEWVANGAMAAFMLLGRQTWSPERTYPTEAQVNSCMKDRGYL